MAKKVSNEQFSTSQYAISDYIHDADEHWGSHEAIVRVMKNGVVVFKQELNVVTLIETNYSFVDILWPKKYESIYYGKYTNEYQVFVYFSGILEIKCTDKKNEEIAITID
ncbi:hypothetical protein EDD76_102289 [Kineothrix alysoides]|uniref:Uncharacterized protein n=1 Tax=Kineothrix alysoides TaxID=1469948 RepID=A0A4R1R502_9FIRM|nr:hypothetical protein [Kineothrix alysoides]TCL60591.1 hypothetical protein EDD76_102289 [Kineothrix alysoides]